MKRSRALLLIGGLTLAVLAVSVPGALRDASQRGGFYLFSAAFLQDLPKRLAGPGRMRFIFQPAMAIFLGIRSGREDARLGRPQFLAGLLHPSHRSELLRSSLESISILLLMGILLDSVFQWILLGISYPVPALVVGPVLITVPYAVARAVAGNIGRGSG
ncbi:MAG: hypothetical protein ACM3JH_09660 [Acidithiobacillales bacterium]